MNNLLVQKDAQSITIGKQLRLLRDQRKVSQQMVADMLGIKRSTYTCYEINRIIPSYEVFLKISDLFDVSLRYLIGQGDAQSDFYKERIQESESISLGKRLKLLRQYNRLSQQMVACAFGIRYDVYNMYETDLVTPPHEMLLKISDLYDISLHCLLKEKQYTFDKNNLRSTYPITINSKLFSLRQYNHLTQQVVADILGIQRSTYAYYETGKVRPPYKTLLAISNLYGISLRFLLGQSNLQVYRAISREKFIHKEEPYS